MKIAIIVIPFLFLAGCYQVRTYEHGLVPTNDMVETGVPKEARSLEVNGWGSVIPRLPDQVVHWEAVDTLADTVWNVYGSVIDTVQHYADGSVTTYYLPRSTFGGSVGWNFSRYFGIGVQGSVGVLADFPNGYSGRIDRLSGRFGTYIRAGGPLGENQRVSLVSRTALSFGTAPRIEYTDSAVVKQQVICAMVDLSSAVQYRPIPVLGITGGAAIFNGIGDFSDESSFMLFRGTFYTGISIMPNRHVAFSPWVGKTLFRQQWGTAMGVRFEFSPPTATRSAADSLSG